MYSSFVFCLPEDGYLMTENIGGHCVYNNFYNTYLVCAVRCCCYCKCHYLVQLSSGVILVNDTCLVRS